jgi:hypothetical protein
MLEYAKRVSPVHVRHLRRLDGRISNGDGWANVKDEFIASGAEFDLEFHLDNETIRVRALTVDRRPQHMGHAYVQVTPEITAEEIAVTC